MYQNSGKLYLTVHDLCQSWSYLMKEHSEFKICLHLDPNIWYVTAISETTNDRLVLNEVFASSVLLQVRDNFQNETLRLRHFSIQEGRCAKWTKPDLLKTVPGREAIIYWNTPLLPLQSFEKLCNIEDIEGLWNAMYSVGYVPETLKNDKPWLEVLQIAPSELAVLWVFKREKNESLPGYHRGAAKSGIGCWWKLVVAVATGNHRKSPLNAGSLRFQLWCPYARWP